MEKDSRELFRMMEIISVLIAVKATQVYPLVRTHIRLCQLFMSINKFEKHMF